MNVATICSKPMILSKLGPTYLHAGVLVTLANQLYDLGSFEDRHHLLVIDDQPDIHAPNDLPENWPVGIIRIYKEIHVDRKRQIELADLSLESIPPSRVGLNSDTVGYSEGVVLDRNGILAYEASLHQRGKALALQGFYLMIDDPEQLSLVPSLAEPRAFSVGDLLEKLPAGILDKYYENKFIRLYEESRVQEELGPEEFGALHGLGMRYLNWEMGNALLTSVVLTALQHKKSVQPQQASEDKNVVEVTLDPNDPDPKGTVDTVASLYKENAERTRGDTSGVTPCDEFGNPQTPSKAEAEALAAGEAEVQRLKGVLEEIPNVYDLPGVNRVDVVAEVEADYAHIEELLWTYTRRQWRSVDLIDRLKEAYAADDDLVIPTSMRAKLDETGREIVIALHLQNELNAEVLHMATVKDPTHFYLDRPARLHDPVGTAGKVELTDGREFGVDVTYRMTGDTTSGFIAEVVTFDGVGATQYDWDVHSFMARFKKLVNHLACS